MASTAEQDRVQVLQRTLYRAAKADPERRFHALYDKVYRRDVLERAWTNVRHNAGAAGIDRTTIADVELYGVTRLLDELAVGLKAGTYRPLPARRVFIDKYGSKENNSGGYWLRRKTISKRMRAKLVEVKGLSPFEWCTSVGFRRCLVSTSS